MDYLVLITEFDELKLPKSHIKEVTSQEKIVNDSRRNGTLIGLAVGGALATTMIVGAVIEPEEGGLAAIGIGIPLVIGVGAGTGFLVDSQFRVREVYFKAAN